LYCGELEIAQRRPTYILNDAAVDRPNRLIVLLDFSEFLKKCNSKQLAILALMSISFLVLVLMTITV